MLAAPTESLPCYEVNNLATTTEDQCKFMLDNDCLDDEANFDFVHFVYCSFGMELRYLSIMWIVFLLVVFFLNLSAVADEFLCPSLLAVAKNLGMSDSLAGVTLLAFGNGCPDIFASLAAASSGRPELIIGELLGAGIFCTSIVAGLILIHSQFKLACRPLLRDATFYLLAVYLIWLYCWEEAITFYGSLGFIVVYVIYLIVALSGQAIHSRLRREYPIAEIHNTSEGDKEDENKTENWFKWREESLRRRSTIFSKSDCTEISALTPHSGLISSHGAASVHFGSDPLGPPSSNKMELNLCSQAIAISNGQGFNNGPVNGYTNKAFEVDVTHDDNRSVETTTTIIQTQQSPKRGSYPFVNSCSISAADEATKLERRRWDELEQFLIKINPINLDEWYQIGLLRKIMSMLRAPLLFVTIMTVPVVDHDKKNSNWCRILNSLHCVLVPTTPILTIRWMTSQNSLICGVPLGIILLWIGIILGIVVFYTSEPYKPPKYHAAFAYVGFIMSVLWVYILAKEVISVLKTIGIMFSMTDTAIGLGILAWGNSLGDIVANLTLANAGYPRMALGASIGAPLLNLLLGFGLSFTLNLKPGQSIPIEYSPTIALLCSTLAIILIVLMLSTTLPASSSKKPLGYLLICSYGVYFALAFCLESGLVDIG